MLDTRKRLFIWLGMSAGLIISAILLYYFVFKQPDEEVIPEEGSELIDSIVEPVFETPPTEDIKITTPVAPVEDVGERYVRQLARNFVERLGSYSNQNGNSHIETVLPLATPSMAKWLETQKLDRSTEYSGKTTKVIVYRVESFGDTTAKVHVEVQEFLQTRDSEDAVYRIGTVNLEKIGSEWKVGGLYWE